LLLCNTEGNNIGEEWERQRGETWMKRWRIEVKSRGKRDKRKKTEGDIEIKGETLGEKEADT
jgi:hypothetical protein